MNSRDGLLAEIKSKAVVHGKVILSSGKEANYYVDLRQELIHQRRQNLNQQLNQASLHQLMVLQLRQVLLDGDLHSNSLLYLTKELLSRGQLLCF